MKKALFKDSIKEIKKTHRRFISILLMAFLGVGFFAGIKASSPDMKKTIDNYYKAQNVYDIEVMSTLGLTDADMEALKNINGITNVYATYSKDATINLGDLEIVAKVHEIEPEINKVLLESGKLPETINECVVEKRFATFTKIKIGDEITLEEKLDEDEESSFKEKKLKVVGIVESPLYISAERGTSSLGDGKVDYYIYINKENINSDIYTEIYAKIDSKNESTTSSEYEKYVEKVKNDIEHIKTEREQARYNSLVDDANKKVSDAEDELNDKQKEADEEFAKADKKIADAEKEISDGEKTLESNKTKADKEFSSADTKLNTAKRELEKNENEFKTKKEEANKQIENTKAELQTQKANLQKVNENLESLNNSLKNVNFKLSNGNLSEAEILTLNATKQELEKNITELEKNKNTLNIAIAKMQEGILQAEKEITDAESQIKEAKNTITKNEKKLKKQKANTYAKIEDARKNLTDAKQKLEDSKKEYNDKKADYEIQITDAKKKIEDAKQKILEIKDAKWYILDRESNSGYNSFVQDTKSIANIGKVFPIVFFVIAALISLTSMTRMVEEERVQIGTLKALGYNKLQIASKYIIYSGLASIIGGSIGMVVGCYVLPPIIWMMYSMMYSVPNFVVEINFEYGLIGLILISICNVGATMYAVWKELINTPAVLMRPKAPKKGKRVLLERIPFIWKRLNFNRKVTVRNIFRYKKRFLMTIIGICGCTALILTGFGIKDSITRLLTDQYGRVFNYDMQINLKDDLSTEEYTELYEYLNNKDGIEETVPAYFSSITVMNNQNEEDVQLIIPEDSKKIEDVINFFDKKTGEKVELSNSEILITDKLAQLIDAKQGDIIIIKNSDGLERKAKIGNIVENYVSHYIYMSKELYTDLYNENYKTNIILTRNAEMEEEQKSELAKDIISKESVTAITQASSMTKYIEDMMGSLNYVVIILIISSGLLAFVVLYNLANVNISERIRELATIKVLGFYDKEVYNYIARETVLLTIIGIGLGLIGGYFLNSFILTTCEIKMLRFNSTIEPLSYVYPVIITIAFTWIVNIFTYFSLKKINMIESLKSVE